VSDASLAFCFGVHNHQPIGNFDGVLRETTERAYHPFFARLKARPEIRMTVHCTGSLLDWLRAEARPTFDLLGEIVAPVASTSPSWRSCPTPTSAGRSSA